MGLVNVFSYSKATEWKIQNLLQAADTTYDWEFGVPKLWYYGVQSERNVLVQQIKGKPCNCIEISAGSPGNPSPLRVVPGAASEINKMESKTGGTFDSCGACEQFCPSNELEGISWKTFQYDKFQPGSCSENGHLCSCFNSKYENMWLGSFDECSSCESQCHNSGYLNFVWSIPQIRMSCLELEEEP